MLKCRVQKNGILEKKVDNSRKKQPPDMRTQSRQLKPDPEMQKNKAATVNDEKHPSLLSSVEGGRERKIRKSQKTVEVFKSLLPARVRNKHIDGVKSAPASPAADTKETAFLIPRSHSNRETPSWKDNSDVTKVNGKFENERCPNTESIKENCLQTDDSMDNTKEETPISRIARVNSMTRHDFHEVGKNKLRYSPSDCSSIKYHSKHKKHPRRLSYSASDTVCVKKKAQKQVLK